MTTLLAPTVAQVTEATRHMCDFRAGLAETLQHLAHAAILRMPDEGQRMLEPLLRILGTERAHEWTARLYVAAARADGSWGDPGIDPDVQQMRLEAMCREAAHLVADEFHRDSTACREATQSTGRGNGTGGGGIQL